MSLLELVQASSNKRNTLFTWTTTTFETLSRLPNYENSELPESVLNKLINIKSQIDTFLQYMTVAEDKENLDSHYVFIRISHVYSMALSRIQNTSPGKIFDGAELLIKVLGEEDVSLPDPAEDSSKKSKKKKGSSKRTHAHSPAKDLAVVMLSQLYELFGDELTSLIPLAYLHIFKNLKKAMEKSKYRHATFMVSLLKLYNIILNQNDESSKDMVYITKFIKLSKNIFECIYESDESFPVDAVSLVIDTWGVILTQEHFVKEHSSNLLDGLFNIFHDSEIGIYGFVNDNTRIVTAKILGDVIFDYVNVKQIISLQEAFQVYIRLFSSATTRDIRSACFESMVHFITLHISINPHFLQGTAYLNILGYIVKIFDDKNIQGLRVGTLARFMRYIGYTHDLILPYINDSSKIQMLIQLLDTIDNSDSESNKKSLGLDETKFSSHWNILITLELIEKLLFDLGASFTNETELTATLNASLLQLCVSDNFSIRIYASRATKVFLSSCKFMIHDIMENSLNVLKNGFSAKGKFEYSKLHGNAFLLANLIELSEKEIVPYELIMKITVFATAFIKNNTTSTSADLYFKGLICWILMSGLMNYKDDYYLKMQTSQLFLFWKVLLTHSFTYRNEEELKRNLEVRTHALTCLLTYLNNTQIDKETAKQISYLLTKCSNFNHSVTLKSKDIDNILLTNENRILQVYMRIKDLINSDFNNSLLLLTMKNFSDPNLYIEPSKNILSSITKLRKNKKKEENKKEKVISLTVDSILRQEGDFAFGLSSKIERNSIRNISSGQPHNRKQAQINKLWVKDEFEWYDTFEEEVTKPISPVLSFDSLFLLYGNESHPQGKSALPKVTTSLIDFSMELFSSVFPYLNSKIQYSVLETLNLSLFSKATTSLRRVAISANVCTTLYQSLLIIQEKQLGLEEFVGKLIADSLKKVEFHNDELLTVLKSECLGLVCAAVSRQLESSRKREYIDEEVKNLTKNLVEIEEPYPRMLFVLGLSSIYKYNPSDTSFKVVHEIVSTLVNDPHPVIHSWSLYAQYYLLEKHLSLDLPLVTDIIVSLEKYISDPSYGVYGDSSIKYNYCNEYNSYQLVSYITRLLTEKIGPNFTELSKETIDSFRNITNSTLLSTDITSIFNGLKIFENIATFKLDSILCERPFIQSIKNILQSSLLLGVGSNKFSNLFTKQTHALPFSAGSNVVAKSFELMIQLLKLEKIDQIGTEFEPLAWRYLVLYPRNSTIRLYFLEWLRCSGYKANWFDKLYIMINTSTQKIFEGTFDNIRSIYTHYHMQLSATMQRGHSGEEEKQMPASEDTINWKTKDLILKLYVKLIHYTKMDTGISSLFNKQFEQLCKIAFQGTSSRVESCNLKGLNILIEVITILKTMNITSKLDKEQLKEQEIQLTSSLMPIFHEGSSSNAVGKAIGVLADIFCFVGMLTHEPTRISDFMVKLLTVFDENNQTTYVAETKFVTRKSRREIEISVLSGWAKITLASVSKKDDHMLQFVEPYWKILVPLWVISLREYLTIFYQGNDISHDSVGLTSDESSESRNTKLLLYKPVWLNFTKAIGALLSTNENVVHSCINQGDLDSFMFLLTARCLDDLSKSDNKSILDSELLSTLHNFLKSVALQKILLDKDIFQEFVAIFERITKNTDIKEKEIAVELIDDFINGYISINRDSENFLTDIDKLYELLRLLLIMVADILPFVQLDNIQDGTSICITSEKITLVNKIFTVLGKDILQFSSMFKADLYACLLYMMGKMLKSAHATDLLPPILSLLKSITQEVVKTGSNLNILDTFYNAVRADLQTNLSTENAIAFYFVLLGNGYSGFKESDMAGLGEMITNAMDNDEEEDFSSRGIKRLIQNEAKSQPTMLLLKHVFHAILSTSKKQASHTVKKNALLLSTLVDSEREEKDKRAAFTLLMIYLSELSDTQIEGKSLSNVIQLIDRNSNLFKDIISDLTSNQRDHIETILKNQIDSAEISNKEGNMTLKSFN